MVTQLLYKHLNVKQKWHTYHSKTIYCDLLMNSNHKEFIDWLRKFQERVREIILNNADNWFHDNSFFRRNRI